MKNCTLNPLRGCGNCWFGTSVSVTNPSAPVVCVCPSTTLGVARMNTCAPLTARPPLAVIFTRAVIGAVRLVTGFGLNPTEATGGLVAPTVFKTGDPLTPDGGFDSHPPPPLPKPNLARRLPPYREGSGWQRASAADCADVRYYNVHATPDTDPDGAAAARAVCCLELIRP